MGELEGDRVRRACRLLHLVDGVLDRVEDGVRAVVSGRLTVGDGDDEDRLLEAALTGVAHDDAVNDLLPELATHWRQALVADILQDLVHSTTIAHIVADAVGKNCVHESDADSIGVE